MSLDLGETEAWKTLVKTQQILKEVKEQLWLAVPLTVATVLQFCLHVISVMFVGHISELALAGASMAISFASVTGFSLLMGMASALDTLCGQSYGAEQYQMLGIHMQRSMLVQLLVSILLSAIWANTGPILVAMGQDPHISKEAGLFARLMIPNTFAFGLIQCILRFLQTQKIVFPVVISSAVTLLLHIVVCWILVFKSGLGFRGAPVANSISFWFNGILLALYVKYSSSCAKTWTGFSKEALHNIIAYLGLAIPSALMVCLELWSFELLVLLSGLLPNPKLETSVLSIIFNTASILYMLTFGFSGAVSTRVSNELGAGKPEAARLASCVVVVMAIIEGLVAGLVVIMIRNVWGYAYSNEREVIRYVASMMFLLAASNFLNGVQCVLSGIARGCGWQKIGALINLGSYYLVGLPCAVVLAFAFHMGGKGFWLGIICALTVQVLAFLVITIRTNWGKEEKKATERVHNSIIPRVDPVST
ncbi:hypothetical protein L1049_027657 [Liquidambar formosana]|uniref:Protein DETOXIFICATION n=1 Tax=Liquidambar formosana TaxID=63359 RepID=A0AAP0RHS2_LIQFO